MRRTALIVEDDPRLQGAMSKELARMDFHVLSTSHYEGAVRHGSEEGRVGKEGRSRGGPGFSGVLFRSLRGARPVSAPSQEKGARADGLSRAADEPLRRRRPA